MADAKECAGACPICGGDNHCGNLTGKPQGECWCSNAVFPQGIFALVPEEKLGKACICIKCLDKF